ncbi:hypothetical protein COF61_01900 [Bacillus toyonensis]|nr:hypothetical protein COF61_01900 [Bacillus toyonensis]
MLKIENESTLVTKDDYCKRGMSIILCSNMLKHEKNTPDVVNRSVFLYIKWHHARSSLLYASKVLNIL